MFTFVKSHTIHVHFQESEWRWSGDSPIPLLKSGFSYLYLQHEFTKDRRNSCAHCSTQNSSLESLKSNTGKLPQQHCSAFEVFPDHSHVIVFPVNCSVKYWSRVLCEDRHKTKYTSDIGGVGEYWIKNNTLMRTDYMCPEGFNIVFDELCISLKIFDKVWLGVIAELGSTDFLIRTMSMYANDQICASLNNNKTIAYKDVNMSISLLHSVADILEEYYPEGSDVYPQDMIFGKKQMQIQEMDRRDLISYLMSYYWLPPPTYPTYMPCFTSRGQALRQDANDVSLIKCEDGSLIADAMVCDGRNDCKNSTDEWKCPFCSWTISVLQSCACDMFYYQCEGGGCVHYDNMCDSFSDCPEGDDEFYCNENNKFPYFNISLVTGSFINDLCDPPSGNMLMCRTKLQCYNSSAICHYDHTGGVMASCEDGSHLGWGSQCHFIECRQHFKCMMSYCIPTRKICDGFIDCPAGEDESYCNEYICPGHMRCSGVTYCVPPHEICDGISHCPRQDDEKYCQVCPHGCQCKGSGIYCYNVTGHLRSNHLYSPSVLLLHNSYSMFVELFRRFLKHMNNIWLISLRNGSFASLLENLVNTTQYFLSVKFLYLNHQGLYTLPPYFINGPKMLHVNLSDNIIQSVQTKAFSLIKTVKTLSFVSNKLKTIEAHFFSELTMLSHLYLNNNPLVYIAAGMFLGNPALVMIRSDFYMVCCVAISTGDCQPQNQFFSSCSDLISSLPQKVALMTQGITVIMCNIGVLAAQFILKHSSSSEKYLIISLGFADFLMGIYLLAISSVDLAYNRIFYIIVSEWTSSITCIMLGLISFVSSEASLLTLCILAYARMFSINKFGGMLLLKAKIRAACVVAWVVIVTTGIACVVCFKTQGLGLRNNMCILFGISPSYQRYISDLEHVLHIILIVATMLVLIVTIVSMANMFSISVKSYRSVINIGGQHNKSRKMRLIHIGFRLLLLASCNVLTWIPVLTVSTFLLVGLHVPDIILQWVVVLGLPICSITNPILYNLPAIKAYINTNRK